MKYEKLGSAIGIVTLAFGLSGWANSACVISEDNNASSVQEDSGNGNYDCSLFTTADGGTLEDVTTVVDPKINPDDGTVSWEVPSDVDGNPTIDVDLVSVSRNSGQRCNYLYADQALDDSGLTTSDGARPPL